MSDERCEKVRSDTLLYLVVIIVSIDNMVDFGKTHSLYKPPNLPSRPKPPNLPSRPNLQSRLKHPIPSSRVTHLTKTTFPFSATAPIIFGFSFINFLRKKNIYISYLPNQRRKI